MRLLVSKTTTPDLPAASPLQRAPPIPPCPRRVRRMPPPPPAPRTPSPTAARTPTPGPTHTPGPTPSPAPTPARSSTCLAPSRFQAQEGRQEQRPGSELPQQEEAAPEATAGRAVPRARQDRWGWVGFGLERCAWELTLRMSCPAVRHVPKPQLVCPNRPWRVLVLHLVSVVLASACPNRCSPLAAGAPAL